MNNVIDECKFQSVDTSEDLLRTFRLPFGDQACAFDQPRTEDGVVEICLRLLQ